MRGTPRRDIIYIAVTYSAKAAYIAVVVQTNCDVAKRIESPNNSRVDRLWSDNSDLALTVGRDAKKPMINLTRRRFQSFALAAITLGSQLPALVFAAPQAHRSSNSPPVTIFAAASMKTALDAVAAAWKAETGKTTSIVYASSASLARQIDYGAPADIFISADLTWMDYLDKAKLIQPGTRRNLLGNALVLIESADSGGDFKIAPGFDLAGATGEQQGRGLRHYLMPWGHVREAGAGEPRRFRQGRTKARASGQYPHRANSRLSRGG